MIIQEQKMDWKQKYAITQRHSKNILVDPYQVPFKLKAQVIHQQTMGRIQSHCIQNKEHSHQRLFLDQDYLHCAIK